MKGEYEEKAGDSNSKLVCKLQKSLYRIRQASRQWNLKFTECLLQNGFSHTKVDYCLQSKKVQALLKF